MPVLESAAERRRVVADVVGAEWNHFGGLQWTPELVAQVDADIEAGDLENHFHESVPYVQLGLMLLAATEPEPTADDEVLAGLVAEFLPSSAVPAGSVERIRRRRRELGDESDDLTVVDEYIRFGLRVLETARGSQGAAMSPSR